MLAEFGGTAYIDSLGQLLSDAEMRGHAIKALAKAKAPGFSAAVQGILNDEKERWIKSAAKKYLEFDASES